MHHFHKIPTDRFKPVSHDKSYLFHHYDKVANFLAFNLDKNFKSILAKPVQNGYSIDWYSVHGALINIQELGEADREKALKKYWEFIELISDKINRLGTSQNENNKNWSGLLTKVFNHNDNFIFTNGSDISIVWGWQFENQENYRPNLISGETQGDSVSEPTAKSMDIDEVPQIPETPEKDAEESFEEEEDEEFILEEVIDEVQPEEITEPRLGFLDFLKWFASRYWWSLGVLLAIILAVLLWKSIENHKYKIMVENKLQDIEINAGT